MEPQDSGGKPESKAAPLQLLLPAPSLPTVSQKLAQQIWGLDGRILVHSLDDGNPAMVQQGVLGALQQLQQVGNARRVEIYCNDLASVLFIIYCMAIMSKQRAELVAPIIAHMHRMMHLHTVRGGMLHLQFDWKARRVMKADGPTL